MISADITLQNSPETINGGALNEHGFGYVRRPAIWLTINKNRELAHPNSDGRYGHNDELKNAGPRTPDVRES